MSLESNYSRSSKEQVEAVGKMSLGSWRKVSVGWPINPSGGTLLAPVKKMRTSFRPMLILPSSREGSTSTEALSRPTADNVPSVHGCKQI